MTGLWFMVYGFLFMVFCLWLEPYSKPNQKPQTINHKPNLLFSSGEQSFA